MTEEELKIKNSLTRRQINIIRRIAAGGGAFTRGASRVTHKEMTVLWNLGFQFQCESVHGADLSKGWVYLRSVTAMERARRLELIP